MGYQIVEIFSRLSIFIGVAISACAFMLPNGWRTPLGIGVIVLGIIVILASVTYAPNGQTWMKSFLTEIVLGY